MEISHRSRDSLVVDCQTYRKVASSNPDRNGGEFSSLELTFCADFYLASIPTLCYGSDM